MCCAVLDMLTHTHWPKHAGAKAACVPHNCGGVKAMQSDWITEVEVVHQAILPLSVGIFLFNLCKRVVSSFSRGCICVLCFVSSSE